MIRCLTLVKDEKDRLLEVFRKEVAALERSREIRSTAEQRITKLEMELEDIKKQITPELLRTNAEIQQELAPFRDERRKVDRIHADRKARIKDLEIDIKSLEVEIDEFSKSIIYR